MCLCAICGKPIGYETRFYKHGSSVSALVHATCEELRAEKKDFAENPFERSAMGGHY